MTAHPSHKRRPARSAQSTGARPPTPSIGRWLRLGVWLLLSAASTLLWFQEPLQLWAGLQQVMRPITAAPAPLPFPVLPTIAPELLLAALLQALFQPPVRDYLVLGRAIGLGLLALELLLLVLLPLIQAHGRQQALRIVLRVRALPHPSSPLVDAELLRTLHALLPHRPLAALLGREPTLALILHGQAGQPLELRIALAAPTSDQLRTLLTAVQAALLGHTPGGCTELLAPAPPTAMPPSALLAWQTFRLTGPLALPLRTLADSEGDLLGPLAAALRPTHIVMTELHLRLRPLHGWALRTGWRADGLRRLLRLQQRADHALSADAKRLESRLAQLAFAATLDMRLIATGPAAATLATAAIQQVRDALSRYAVRTGPWHQTIGPAGGGRCRMATAAGVRRREWLARRAPAPSGLPRLLLPLPAAQPALILTVDELVGLWHLPTLPLSGLVDQLGCRQLPALLHAIEPLVRVKTIPYDPWVAVGQARGPDGRLRRVGLTLRDLRYVLHLTAGMGAGKSRLLANLCRQFLGSGYCLIDGKGDDAGGLASFVLTLIPTDQEARVVILDPRDARWPVGLNPLAGVNRDQPGALDQAVATIFALFARIDPETWGGAQGMRDFLDKALRLVLASEPQPTLAHVKQALLDDAYRAQLLPVCRNRDVVDYWTTVFPRLGEGQRSSRDALLRRFDKLLSADLLRLVITRPQPALQLDTAIAERAILICPIPNVALGDLAGVYAMLLFQQFLRAAFARPGTDQDRVDYPLVIDELQVLIAEAANDDITTALSRLRSFAIPLVIAHQALSQLGPVEPLVHINAENRVILKVREPDASVYARQYGHQGLTASDIANQDPNTHQYAILRAGGQPAGPFSMEPLPWPVPDSAALPDYCGPPWQSVLPADSPDPSSDRLVAQLVYTEVPSDELNRLAEQLARMPGDEFAVLLSRWEAIRQCQLAHIAAHPGCIRDKAARIRWRSRLRYALPYVLAEAQYRRARPAIAPEAAEGRRRGPTGAPASAGVASAPEPPPFTQADRQPAAAAPPPISAPRYPHDDDAG